MGVWLVGCGRQSKYKSGKNKAGKYRAVLSEGEFIKYEKLFKKFDENGNGILTSAEAGDAEHRGEESGMTFDSMVELLERDHQGGKVAWFVTGVAVNLPESADFKDVEATIHLEQAALEFDDRVSAVWEEEDTLKQGFVTLFQEAFGRLMLPTFDEEIDQILEPFRDSGQVSEAGFFRIMRYEFRNAKISWAEYKVVRQAKERQRIAARARARLLLYKGTVNKVRETVVACSYKSINSGDVFLLDGYYSLFLWIGKFAGDHEAEAGKEGMERLVQQRRGMEVSETIVREGHEPTDFW
ncbi:hypothetical protein T484DRAFT_1809400 [Baffinella frigidus]|nr:hypothetical protein T484DRAFT_1809400 [Cryptophyta sp. CCMP2293]